MPRGLINSLDRDGVFQILCKFTSVGEETIVETEFQREMESQSSRPGRFQSLPCGICSQYKRAIPLSCSWHNLLIYTHDSVASPFETLHCLPIGLMIWVKPSAVASTNASLPDSHMSLSFPLVSDLFLPEALSHLPN